MMKDLVYITRKLPEETIAGLKEHYQVEMWDKEDIPVPAEVLREKAKEASALLTMLSDSIDGDLLAEAHRLKVVANLAVGYDNIDVKAAAEKGITVANTPDVLTDTTADLTFALLMAAARRITESAEYVKEGKWKSWSPLLLAGQDIHHKTIGIVGMGNIGQAVAKRAKGFDMNILYHNRSRRPEAEESLGAVYVSFEELCEQSDYVVCLAPLNDSTKNLFTEEAFRRMKNSAIFINAGRGAIVDEEALYRALADGEISGAGLDVFVKEPIGKDHPLLSLPNVVALPHIGSSSTETRMEMARLCAENIDLVLSGNQAKTPVHM
ncbi:D-glycerate dehydrogenase [Bacillus infantis]|nr:D-glycerate dehydrogenase [Bacillus infantis]MCR6612565.1 D-glycerate dehydrogenase [Bacillus infantis]